MTPFNWHDTLAKRPIFAVDYWPGIPAIDHEGRADITHDLEHIKAYCDPVLVRSLCLHLKSTDAMPEQPDRGWFDGPDLVNAAPEQMEQWRQRVAELVGPLAKQYRDAGMQVIELTQGFNCSGWDYAPDWYKQAVADWQECDLSGKPLTDAGLLPMACLVHPKLYEFLEQFYEAMRVLSDTGVLLGGCTDNESHLAHHDLANFGGHPLTLRAFGEYVAQHYGDVATFNNIAKTTYDDFADIGIADDNWAVRTLAVRFRATLVTKHYQNGMGRAAKKAIPGFVTVTRLAVGACLRENLLDRECPGLDLTYLDPQAIDVMGWSHSISPGEKFDLVGGMCVAGDLMRGLGIPIGITEPHVQRYGPHYSPYRPDELLHLIYRGLHYNFRFFNLHTWDRTGDWQIWNEPVAAVYMQRKGILKQVRELRDELDYIRPFETFGKPVLAPLRILTTRNARGYPAMQGRLYGELLADLGPIFEKPQMSCYHVIEEQTSDLDETLAGAKGVIVADACLTADTRRRLSAFVESGGKLLVIGAPACVDEKYAPAQLPACYPIASLDPVDLAELEQRDITQQPYAPAPFPSMCSSTGRHPVWPSASPLVLAHPTVLTPESDATPIAHDWQGNCIAAGNDRVAYLAGPPTQRDQLGALMRRFAAWCGVELPQVMVSQFEHATVAQHYNSANLTPAGDVIDPAPWHGYVPLHGELNNQVREMREEHPWLAYHTDENGSTVLEGVALDPQAVKVFRRQPGTREFVHFENLPPSVGFTRFWCGEIHPVIGRFSVLEPTVVDGARLVACDYDEAGLGWYVTPVGSPKRVAEAVSCDVNFAVEPGRDYYLVAVTRRHANLPTCPLCTHGRFE